MGGPAQPSLFHYRFYRSIAFFSFSPYLLTVIICTDLVDYQPGYILYIFIGTSCKGQKTEHDCGRTGQVGVLKINRTTEPSHPEV